ncbi:MAG: hypothetical protein WC096_00490 [Sphaerochaetaceae bacterium]
MTVEIEAKKLKKIVEVVKAAIGSNAADLDITLRPTGATLDMLDPANVLYIHMDLSSDDDSISKWDISEKRCISLDIDKTLAVCKLSTGLISCKLTEDGSTVIMTTGHITRRMSISYLEETARIPKCAASDDAVQVKVTPDMLLKVLKYGADISPEVIISMTGNTMTASMQGATDEMCSVSDCDEVIHPSNEKVDVILFANYLYNFLKSLPPIVMTMFLEENMPLIIEVTDKGVHLKYVLAPCIKETDL